MSARPKQLPHRALPLAAREGLLATHREVVRRVRKRAVVVVWEDERKGGRG